MFKTKGWQHNGKINKDDEQMVYSKGEIGLAGDDRNISTKTRTTMNGGKVREANISINDLLPTGTLALDMATDPRPPANTQEEIGAAQ